MDGEIAEDEQMSRNLARHGLGGAQAPLPQFLVSPKIEFSHYAILCF